jgi:HK97 family phage major capsid protein
MKIQELSERRFKLLQDAQTILLSGNVDAEKRTSASKMIVDADALEADIAALKKIEAASDEYRNSERPVRGNASADSLETGVVTPEKRAANEKDAFGQYLRFGRTVPSLDGYLVRSSAGFAANELPKELRDLTVSTGSALIPQAFFPVLTEAQKTWGGLLNLVTRRKVESGAPMKLSTFSDTSNGLSELGESTAPSETDPTLNSAILSTSLLTTGIIKVTISELQDAYFDVDGLIREAFGKRSGRGLNQMITNGSTSGNIASIITGATTGATSAAPTAISYLDLTSLFSSLEPSYIPTSSWAMNSTTRGYFLGITDTLGRAIYTISANVDSFDTLLGRPVVLNQAMQNIVATDVAVQFGDFSSYLLREAAPLAVIRLNERFMDTLEVGFLGYQRAGGSLIDPGSHPVMNLVQHA